MAKTLQSSIDAVVTVPGIMAGEPFQQIEGGDVTAEVVRDRPPGAQFDTPTPGVPTISDITVTTPWDEDRHRPMKSRLDNAVGLVTDATVGKIVRDKDRNKKGQDTYSPCVLIGVASPPGNTTANESAMLALTFAPGGLSSA